MTQISIIGFGWLGLKLAERLKQEDFELVGTVRSMEKKKALSQRFSEVDIFNLDDINNSKETISSLHADWFFLNIPPSASEHYVEKMKLLIDIVFRLNPNSVVIYTSSTSVYGSEAREVTERSTVCPETDNAKKMIQVESHLSSNYSAQSIIIRLGGLVGMDRHPVNYLSNKKKIAKGNTAINLIHEKDICRLMSFILINKIKKGVFNLCCEEHPTKMMYYNWVAKQLNINELDFDLYDNKKDKVVICTAINSINFELRYKSPFDFPISEN